MDSECNGWSNYETWRVSLEFFSDYSFYLSEEGLTPEEINSRVSPEMLEEYVQELLEGECRTSDSTVLSYALAFMSDVNWQEISAHLMLDIIKNNGDKDE